MVGGITLIVSVKQQRVIGPPAYRKVVFPGFAVAGAPQGNPGNALAMLYKQRKPLGVALGQLALYLGG